MRAFCERQGLDLSSVRFLYDGQRLQDDQTPAAVEMQDGNCIQVFLYQTGGWGSQQIYLKVKDADGNEVSFKCKSTAKLEDVMDSFCQQRGRSPGSLRFFTSDGTRIDDDDTPKSLILDDGDVTNAHEKQQGRGS
ncbi:hypothetical protein ONS95_001582 [Cadophora gregata]|uniref:uncharacterized protein n=1 Tax=Cadophora gregata TaxID=51156 RepID=UPI0026DB12E5|nr:uncharacterized protein ONS95_001582 [Cadophora gregata]KAK0111207.1 hypothetical protein ONS95_001582 [Cadophora gregata]KAK0112320.1 hypothetical protein ONS96_001568 [Cadophora gregata f. sp. sojae]